MKRFQRKIDPVLYKELVNVYSELPTITSEEIKRLMPMFVSPDQEIRELASQVLFTTNFFNIPGTIDFIWQLYPTPTLSEMRSFTRYEPEKSDVDKQLEEIITNENTWIR